MTAARMPLLHAEEVAEKGRGRPLPDGRGSVSGCKHDTPILSHDRKGVGRRLFQQPLKRAPRRRFFLTWSKRHPGGRRVAGGLRYHGLFPKCYASKLPANRMANAWLLRWRACPRACPYRFPPSIASCGGASRATAAADG